jgi:N-sulfoglucosamine sulfohydrolase
MNKYLILPIAAGMVACGEMEEPLDPPNILWITHEDLSPIYGCYGDEYATTPNIDKIAETGIMFSKAFSNAPICAPARSTLITGMYATSLGTQHLRSDIPLPADFKILPEYLREAGYYTTNNVKTDYNFDHTGRWDESSNQAHWRNRPEGKPFFSVFNHMITHEGPTNALRASDTETLDFRHDPDLVQLPPYLPDSPKMREIWAHKYDLLSVFDQQVGELLEQLKEDGLEENTIIFLFSDHGTGLPGHKRWLNNAGLQVPFIIHIPEKYKKWAANLKAPVADHMVGFVDFAPTVLTLAGVEVPEMMQGNNFLGRRSTPQDYIFGYRDRADDCYEMSRSVFDGRYLYVRHFMPQLAYYQNAVIFNKGGSYEEINRLHDLGELPPGTLAMMNPKPVEELFDLQNDPFEQNNLIGQREHSGLISHLREKLNDWMVDHYDTGLLNEGEYMERARISGTSVYHVPREYSKTAFREILNAAKLVGKITEANELIPVLSADDSAIKYWGLIATDAFEGDISELDPLLFQLLNDPSHIVAITAAEILIQRYNSPEGLEVLNQKLRLEQEPVVLQAAISVRKIGRKARPLVDAIQNEILPAYSGNVWGRYRSWSYPMFIGMALDQAMINCGIEINIRN